MIRLTEIALRNKSIVLLLSAALFISGLVAWGSLHQELLPDIELPFITVIAAQPGAGAEDVAQQVTVPIEQAIKSVPRLEALSSTSANSLSLVIAQFEYGTNIKDTQRGHRDAPWARRRCPSASTPRVSAVNINDQPVIVAAVGPAAGADDARGCRRRGGHRAHRAAAAHPGHPRCLGRRPDRWHDHAPRHHPRPDRRWPMPGSASSRSRACSRPTS